MTAEYVSFQIAQFENRQEYLLQPPCHIPYAFIIGANPDAPTELEDYSDDMIINPSTIENAEDDVVYLNIRENMENGKSVSYFKYASSLAKRYDIDYIGKCDSDTLIHMKMFYKVIEDELPPRPYNVRMYGGSSWGNYDTNGIYAAGAFYFLSYDLAHYVSKTLTHQERMKLTSKHPTEDLDMGTFVFSHYNAVKFINYSTYHL